MPIIDVPVGIQSWCFRGFKSNADVCDHLKSCGVDSIELCGVHVNFNDADDVKACIATYKDAGIRIVATGVNTLAGDIDRERPLFEFLKLAGAKYMSVSFPVGIDTAALKRIESLATEYDVHLGIHNHGGKHWLGSPEMIRHIFTLTTPRIGLWIDTAWALDAGADPIAMVKEFGERLYGIHIKDFTFDTARRPTDVVVGTGNLDLNVLAQTLAAVNFTGPAVIEYEGDVENPVPALTSCVVAIRKAFAG